jgi:hypothetical protein
MRLISYIGLAALAFGVALGAAPADAKKMMHHKKVMKVAYPNTLPDGTPLSPAGVGSNGVKGPGYGGPQHMAGAVPKYPSVLKDGTPLSPAGVGSNGVKGPGYGGPQHMAAMVPKYPNTLPDGTPLSPAGVGSNGVKGPGYGGP